MTKTDSLDERNKPRDRSEEIVRRLRNNRFIAPLIALAVLSLAVLTYIGSVHDAWLKVRALFGSKQLQGQLEQRQKDHDLASFNLGQYIAEREIYLESSYAKDERKNKQNLAEVGAELKVLGIDVDYQNLDYQPRYDEIMGIERSEGEILIKNKVALLHEPQVMNYYTIGRETGILWHLEQTDPAYHKLTAIGSLRLLEEATKAENLQSDLVHWELTRFDDGKEWTNEKTRYISVFAFNFNVRVNLKLGGSRGFRAIRSIPDED